MHTAGLTDNVDGKIRTSKKQQTWNIPHFQKEGCAARAKELQMMSKSTKNKNPHILTDHYSFK